MNVYARALSPDVLSEDQSILADGLVCLGGSLAE